MTFTWEHVLYRFYGEDGSLLYVGITNSITTRFKGHAATQPWWSEVADCRVAFYSDWPALARAEHDAIKYERPRYNRQGGSMQPVVVAARRRPEPAPKSRPLAPCIPADATKPWHGCTCRSQAEHYGDNWPLVSGGA